MNAVVLPNFNLITRGNKNELFSGRRSGCGREWPDFEQAAEIEQAAADDILGARFQLFANDKKALKANEVRKTNSGQITLSVFAAFLDVRR